MMGDELARIVASGFIQFGILVRVQEQVIAHATPDERLLDARQGIHGPVNVEQRTMVGIQIGTYGRMDAGGTFALVAQVFVPPFHAVHICTGAAQIAQIALEIGKLLDGLHLAQDAFLGAADDELALMGRDGAEGTSAETSAMDVDRKLNHVIRRNPLSLVFGMGQTGIGQVEGMIQFGFCHGRIRRVNHHCTLPHTLKDAAGFVLVTLLLDMTEVCSLIALVLQAHFVCIEQNVFLACNDIIRQIGNLRNIANQRLQRG